MNKKALYGLAGVFTLLLVIATQPYWDKYLGLNRFTSGDGEYSLDMPNPITQISFRPEGEADYLELIRQNDQWQVNGFKVDETLINQLVEDLNSLKVDSVASTNIDNFITYAASDSGARIKVANSAGTEAEYIVGEDGIQPNTVYLRPADEDVVYLVRSDLRGFLFNTEAMWRDKSILDIAETDIEQVSVTQNGQTIIVSRNEEGQWVGTRGTETRIIGDVAQERFFDTFSPLEGTGFADQDQVTIFEQSIRPVVIEIKRTGQDLPEQLSLVEDQTNTVWLVSTSESEEIFTLSPAIVQTVTEDLFTLFD